MNKNITSCSKILFRLLVVVSIVLPTFNSGKISANEMSRTVAQKNVNSNQSETVLEKEKNGEYESVYSTQLKVADGQVEIEVFLNPKNCRDGIIQIDNEKNPVKIPEGIRVKDWDDAFNFMELLVKMEKLNEHSFIIALTKERDN